MQKFVQHYFDYFLVVSSLVAFFIPSLQQGVSVIVLVLLACIVFASFFQLTFDWKPLLKSSYQALWFIGLRYLLLPLPVYFIVSYWSSFYALVFALLVMLPAAVSSPAVTAMFGGNYTLALAVTILSNFMSVLWIPFFSSWFASNLNIDRLQMFYTLVLTLVVPFLLHLPFRLHAPSVNFVRRNNQVIAVVCLSLMYIVTVSANKHVILADISNLLLYFCLAFVSYLFFFVLVFYFQPNTLQHNRMTLAVASAMNNVGLGVSLTLIYFPSNISTFFIIGQWAWVVALIPLKIWLRKYATPKV